MRKTILFPLVLALALTFCPPARAVEPVVPAPPSWCPAEEYAVFADGAAYETATWDKILSLREHAGAGNPEPQSGTDTVLFNRLRELKRMGGASVNFEVGLLKVKYALNTAAKGQTAKIGADFESAAYGASGQASPRALAYLWNARAGLWDQDLTDGLEGRGLGRFVGAVEYLLPDPRFTMAQVLDWGAANGVSAGNLAAAKALLFVTLDGEVVHPKAVRVSADYLDTTVPQVRNQRTMVPVRRLAELMGATVDYDAAARRITIRRAGDTFVMTLDSTEALRNGEHFQMDVAPYAENNRTYIPIRYIAEFFGQKVEWNGAQQHVVITEDKSAAGDSNLEAWALAMGAVLNYESNPHEVTLFGGKARFGAGPVGGEVTNRHETTGPDFGRKILREGWGIEDREALITTAETLAVGADAWDWFRASHLAQWGYLAGYVTYPEALALVEPAAQKVCETYGSWDEAQGAYLAGYCKWAGLSAADIWATPRGQLYGEMKADPAVAPIFDDALFQTGVMGLPEMAE